MPNRLIHKILFVTTLLSVCPAAVASLEPLADEGMSEVTGEGLAMSFTNFDMVAGPTSYFEFTGAAAPTGWQRADGRYYGISITSMTGGTAWVGPCTSGTDNMGCPMGGPITYFAAFDNPFILRVFDYSAINYSGSTVSQSVFELLAPSNSDPFKWSMWTELDVGNNSQTFPPANTATTGFTQGQMIMSNETLSAPLPGYNTRGNNKIRIVAHTDPADPTVGFIWENFWAGDFRYSVNQLFSSPNAFATPPWFQDNEGFYAVHITAHVPLGQLFYQDITLNSTPAHDGNFLMQLTMIPNNSTVYGDFYSFSPADSTYTGYFLGYKRTSRPNHYYDTHGYFTIGTNCTAAAYIAGTTCTNTGTGVGAPGTSGGTTNTAGGKQTDTSDGIFFIKGAASPNFTAYAERPVINPGGDPTAPSSYFGGAAAAYQTVQYGGNQATPQTYFFNGLTQVNLGGVSVQGILINHLSITTCSATGSSTC